MPFLQNSKFGSAQALRFVKCLDLTTLFLRLRRNSQCSVRCVLEFHKFVSICYHTDKVPIRYHKIVENYSIFIQFSLQPLNLAFHLTSHVLDKDCSSEALPSIITLKKNNNQYRKETLCRFCRSSKLSELRSCNFTKIVAFAAARQFSIIPFSQRNAKATTAYNFTHI